MQVNSLGLTEQQPENNVYRILIEMLAVTLSKNARARAVQLPAWNEALGLPRPFDQQWSLRCSRSWPMRPTFWNMTTFSTATTDIAAKVAELKAEAQAELASVRRDGRCGRRRSRSAI